MGDHLFIDFANSELFDGRGNRQDDLLDRSWRATFLEKWGLSGVEPLSESNLYELIGLRTATRSIVERLDRGRTPARRDLERINGALARSPVHFRLTRRPGEFELAVVPAAAPDVTTLAGEIALSAARFLAEEEPERLKMCDNGGCRWVFYDETKNRSRKWCRTCGNVDKVRRFRERQRAAGRGTAKP